MFDTHSMMHTIANQKRTEIGIIDILKQNLKYLALKFYSHKSLLCGLTLRVFEKVKLLGIVWKINQYPYN